MIMRMMMVVAFPSCALTLSTAEEIVRGRRGKEVQFL